MCRLPPWLIFYSAPEPQESLSPAEDFHCFCPASSHLIPLRVFGLQELLCFNPPLAVHSALVDLEQTELSSCRFTKLPQKRISTVVGFTKGRWSCLLLRSLFIPGRCLAQVQDSRGTETSRVGLKRGSGGT